MHDSQKHSGTMHKLSDDEEVAITHYPVILEIKNPDAEKILEDLDAIVFYSRGDLYLTSIPIENLETIPRDKGIDNYSISLPASACLDVARPAAGIDMAHSYLHTVESIDAEHSVVTGICDVGFDPRHEVFRNCLKRWIIYDEYHGVRTEYDGYDNIVANGPDTDDIAKSHATHVGGILAGYAPGIPYYGVAPASDFVATVSNLSDVGICAGIEDIISYAKETGRPAVVNISAGSYLGPHDGTDLVGRYINALAEDAIICFSAGNYGERANCQSLDLDDFPEAIGSAWCDMTWLGFNVEGGTDFWSADERPFEFRFVAWDMETRDFLYMTDWMGRDGENGEFFLDLENTPWFDNGGVWASWGIDENNNRFNVALEYNYQNSVFQTGCVWTRYVVGYHIRAITPNCHVDVYSDGIQSFLHGMGIKWCERGNPDGSISNLACGPNVLAVGAWNSRTSVPDLEAGSRDLGLDVGSVAPWSAYGDTVDGRHLPHVCGPGNVVISALSYPYTLIEHNDPWDNAAYTAFDHNGYKYFADAGTSMSSPLVAGVIALWLQADSSLNINDIKHIIANSARTDDIKDIDNPRWGAGAIDAIRGLNYINSTQEIEIDKTKPIVTSEHGNVSVIWPGVEKPIVTIFDALGRTVINNSIPSGIYIVSVTSLDKTKAYRTKLIINNN